MDVRIRELERRAAYGDEHAALRHKQALCRSEGHPNFYRIDQVLKVAFPRKTWQKYVEERASDLEKKSTVEIKCVRCEHTETLVGHPPPLTISSDGVYTFRFSNLASNADSYFSKDENKEETGFQQPYTWHPTKPRHWQKGNKKAKRRAKKRARRRNR
tara:strand:- start:266 stop:739 length:474 start_codon:yes stop_codon:yes gene_type:complete